MTSSNILCWHPHNLLREVTIKKLKSRKEAHQKIFYGPSNMQKNFNICLKYFMHPAKTLRPSSIYLMYGPWVFFEYFQSLRKMLIRPNIKLFRRCFLKVSMWFSQGLQCTALPVSYDRKTEKNSEVWRCLWCIINRFNLKPLIAFRITFS